MGAKPSVNYRDVNGPAERSYSDENDRVLSSARTKDEEIRKILLYGTGESGKSTLFKQLTIQFGTGFSLEDSKEFVRVIHWNIIDSMQKLIFHCDGDLGSIKGKKAVQAGEQVTMLNGSEVIDIEIGKCIKRLWQDPGVQEVYEKRNQFERRILESSKLFFDEIDGICQPNWLPEPRHILAARVRTTGIVEGEFDINQHKIQFFDVGGQKNERTKWIHYFEKITAIIFVVGLSSFDQISDDTKKNALLEAIDLFQNIANSQWFQNTPIIVFLNKRDIFQEKLATSGKFSSYFPSYAGNNSYDDCLSFIKLQFESRNKSPKRRVFVYEICALNADEVSRLVGLVVQDHLVTQSFEDLGLVKSSSRY